MSASSSSNTNSSNSSNIVPDKATQRLEHFLDNVLRKDLARVLAERDNCYNAASQCVQLRQLLTDLHDLGKVRTVNINVAADEMPESEEANRLANAGEAKAAVFSSKSAEGEGEGKTPLLKEDPKISAANRKMLADMLGMVDENDDDFGRGKKNKTVLHKSVTVCDSQVADPTPLQLLCDVSGNNYFEVEGSSNSNAAAASSSSTAGGADAANSNSNNGALGAPIRPSANNNNNYHFFMPADIANPAIVHINIGCGVVAPMTHEEAHVFLKKKEQMYRDQSQRLSRESLRVRFRIRLVMEAITRLQDSIMGVAGGVAQQQK